MALKTKKGVVSAVVALFAVALAGGAFGAQEYAAEGAEAGNSGFEALYVAEYPEDSGQEGSVYQPGEEYQYPEEGYPEEYYGNEPYYGQEYQYGQPGYEVEDQGYADPAQGGEQPVYEEEGYAVYPEDQQYGGDGYEEQYQGDGEGYESATQPYQQYEKPPAYSDEYQYEEPVTEYQGEQEWREGRSTADPSGCWFVGSNSLRRCRRRRGVGRWRN